MDGFFSRRKISIAVYEGVQLIDIAGPVDVFSTANSCLEEVERDAAYSIELVGIDVGQFQTSSGIAIGAQRSLADMSPSRSDTILVAGGMTARAEAERPAWRRELTRLSLKAERLGSVCQGAWILAGAGLLNGRRAVTHWSSCDLLRATYPEVTVMPDAIYVQDGHIWTSAGMTSGIDLALAMVEADLGREIALKVARILVVFLQRPGGQSQFSAVLSGQMAERAGISDVQRFVVEHPSDDLSIDALASRAALSPRHFSRIFTGETGITPGVFVENVRLETARRLMEKTDFSLDLVADRSGFGAADTMRRVFLRRLGVPPRDYRARFQASDKTDGNFEEERHP